MYTLKSALMQLVQLEQAAASSLAKQLRSTGLIIYHAQFMNTIVPSFFFSWFMQLPGNPSMPSGSFLRIMEIEIWSAEWSLNCSSMSKKEYVKARQGDHPYCHRRKSQLSFSMKYVMTKTGFWKQQWADEKEEDTMRTERELSFEVIIPPQRSWWAAAAAGERTGIYLKPSFDFLTNRTDQQHHACSSNFY